MGCELQCPACGKTSVLETPPATGSWTCSCGSRFEVEAQPEAAAETPSAPSPAAGAAAGMKSCPECGSVVPESQVLCTECGYNFQRGRKIAAGPVNTAGLEDPDVQERRYRKRTAIGLAVALAVLLAAGGAVYLVLTAKAYGVSRSRPMGTAEALEKHVTTQMKMTRDGQPRPAPAGLGTPATVVRYRDVMMEKETNGRFTESLVLALDAQNRICGVSGTFHVWSSSIPGAGFSRAASFLQDYWEEIGAPTPPAFQSVSRPSPFGGPAITGEQAEFSAKGVRAVWSRSQIDSMGLIASMDTITVVREGLSPAALQSGTGADDEEDEPATPKTTLSPNAIPASPAKPKSAEDAAADE